MSAYTEMIRAMRDFRKAEENIKAARVDLELAFKLNDNLNYMSFLHVPGSERIELRKPRSTEMVDRAIKKLRDAEFALDILGIEGIV